MRSCVFSVSSDIFDLDFTSLFNATVVDLLREAAQIVGKTQGRPTVMNLEWGI
jgi:hypothetical protein